jgi:hypothetical protein
MSEPVAPLSAEEIVAWAATVESATPAWMTETDRAMAIDFPTRVLATINALIAECGMWRQAYAARLRGEVARMDGDPITASPFGVFDDGDDSPDAEIAADWLYGWEHQDWVERVK